jgi:hypothetical protein
MLRTAVHSITIARGEPKEKIEVFNGMPLRRMLAPLVRIKPGYVVDLTQEELDYLNREAPVSIRKPNNDELAAYKEAGGKGDESKAATPTDQEKLAAQQAADAEQAAALQVQADAEAAAAAEAAAGKSGKKGSAAADADGL